MSISKAMKETWEAQEKARREAAYYRKDRDDEMRGYDKNVETLISVSILSELEEVLTNAEEALAHRIVSGSEVQGRIHKLREQITGVILGT